MGFFSKCEGELPELGHCGVEIHQQDGAAALVQNFSSKIPAEVQLKFLLQLEMHHFKAELHEVAAGVFTWGSAPGLGGVWEPGAGMEMGIFSCH